MNDLDHMRISGTEPSSVILSQTCSIKSWKEMTKKCQIKLKPTGWCNKPTKLKTWSCQWFVIKLWGISIISLTYLLCGISFYYVTVDFALNVSLMQYRCNFIWKTVKSPSILSVKRNYELLYRYKSVQNYDSIRVIKHILRKPWLNVDVWKYIWVNFGFTH